MQIEKLSERSRKRIEIRFLWEHPFLPMPSSAITEVKSLKKECNTDSRITIDFTGREKQSWGSHWLIHTGAGPFLFHLLRVKE